MVKEGFAQKMYTAVEKNTKINRLASILPEAVFGYCPCLGAARAEGGTIAPRYEMLGRGQCNDAITLIGKNPGNGIRFSPKHFGISRTPNHNNQG